MLDLSASNPKTRLVTIRLAFLGTFPDVIELLLSRTGLSNQDCWVGASHEIRRRVSGSEEEARQEHPSRIPGLPIEIERIASYTPYTECCLVSAIPTPTPKR